MSARGPPVASSASLIQLRALLSMGAKKSARAVTGLPIEPAAMWSRKNFTLSSKRITWATPSKTLAARAASTISRACCGFMAIGFSHKHRLAMAHRLQNVGVMQSVRAGDEHRVHVRTSTELRP